MWAASLWGLACSHGSPPVGDAAGDLRPLAAQGSGDVESDGDAATTVEWPRGAVDAAASQADGEPAVPVCTAMCDAVTPSDPILTSEGGLGNVTMYTTAASNGGACNYGATDVVYFAAVDVNLNPGDGLGEWQGGRICGQCLEVTAYTSQGPQSVVVRIMDKCPDGYCGIDLGGAAPAAIMRDGFGRYDGRWRLVSCTGHPEVSDGPTSLAVAAGANTYWSRVQVRNPPAAVTAMTWTDGQDGSGIFAYASDPENTFVVPTALLASGATSITITAAFSDASSASVQVSPAQLAIGDTSYPMK